MKLAHKIKVKVFSYEKNNEDTSLILEKFTDLFPFNLSEEKLSIKQTNADGLEGRKITILEAALTKEKHTKQKQS